jgi:hypothetical protein
MVLFKYSINDLIHLEEGIKHNFCFNIWQICIELTTTLLYIDFDIIFIKF